jgi:hypothetical protein
MFDRSKCQPRYRSSRNLIINESKTEEYVMQRGEDEDWKECRYLGIMLDTKSDINRQEEIANMSYRKLSKIFRDNINDYMKI